MTSQMQFAVVCLAIFFVASISADCDYNTVCIESRGTITHKEDNFGEEDTTNIHELWWKIVPTSPDGTILLSFKNFFSFNTDFVDVYISKMDDTVETRSFSGSLGNFEIIESDVLSVMINVTQSPNTATDFQIQYYGDCSRATNNFITTHAINNEGQTCYLIAPTVRGLLNRIYVTLRNVILAEDVNLKIQDLHTNEALANIDEDVYYNVVATEFSTLSGGRTDIFILVDLECAAESCNFQNNQFLISYYVMDQMDISCIRVQRFCLRYQEYANVLPASWCKATCPDLTAMLEQEYTFEIMPLLLESDKGTELDSSEVVDYKKKYCPLRRELCQCLDKSDRTDRSYCNVGTRCLRLINESCTWRCILVKVYLCPKLRRLEITLI